jgi:hypothetical protein
MRYQKGDIQKFRLRRVTQVQRDVESAPEAIWRKRPGTHGSHVPCAKVYWYYRIQVAGSHAEPQ